MSSVVNGRKKTRESVDKTLVGVLGSAGLSGTFGTFLVLKNLCAVTLAKMLANDHAQLTYTSFS